MECEGEGGMKRGPISSQSFLLPVIPFRKLSAATDPACNVFRRRQQARQTDGTTFNEIALLTLISYRKKTTTLHLP